MPRLPSRLYGPALLTGADANLMAAVPAGHTYIVRHIHVANTTAGAATLFVSIGADAAATELFGGKSIPANDVFDWFGLLVLVAAEQLKGHSGTASALTITINGDDYTLG